MIVGKMATKVGRLRACVGGGKRKDAFLPLSIARPLRLVVE